MKAAEKNLNALTLRGMKLGRLPTIDNPWELVRSITDLDLSRNNLFNGDEVFEVIWIEGLLLQILMYFCDFRL